MSNAPDNDSEHEGLIAGALIVGAGLASAGIAYLIGKRKAELMTGPRFELAKQLAEKWTGIFTAATVELVLIIAGIESDFNPHTVNSSARAMALGGAWGMMQVTLVTARGLVVELRGKSTPLISVNNALANWNGSGRSLLDPDLNVMLGTYYLDKLSRRFDDDFDMVVAAYQQGPGEVEKLVKAGKKIPDDLPPHGRAYVGMARDWREKLTGQV